MNKITKNKYTRHTKELYKQLSRYSHFSYIDTDIAYHIYLSARGSGKKHYLKERKSKNAKTI